MSPVYILGITELQIYLISQACEVIADKHCVGGLEALNWFRKAEFSIVGKTENGKDTCSADVIFYLYGDRKQRQKVSVFLGEVYKEGKSVYGIITMAFPVNE